MQRIKIAFLTMVIMTFSAYLTNAQENTIKSENFYEIQSAMEKHWDGVPLEDRNGWKQYKRWENFWEERSYPTGEFYNGIDIYQEVKLKDSWYKNNNSTLSKSWESLGPFEKPVHRNNYDGLGRVNCIRIHPNKPNELWVGASTGGVWKSTNNGQTWDNFDFSQFLSIGINDIAFSESNPDIVYVATGDAFGLGHGAMQNYSIGVIKTTNGGETWRTTNFAFEIDEQILIGRLIVNPDDPNTVIAATSRGIYKTTDGGNNWTQKNSSAFFIDMEAHPDDKNIMYASTFSWSGNGQIHRTKDNGETWELIRNIPNVVRIALAVTPAEPDYVYALSARQGYTSFHSVQVSDEAGDNWTIVSDYQSNPNYLGRLFGEGSDANVGQGAYDLAIAVNPRNAYEVFIGGINIWYSQSNGMDFSISSHWYGAHNIPYVHADIHDLVFSRDGKTIYSTHDGGVDKSTNNGNIWTSISNGLVVTQFYRIGSSAQDPNFIIGGTQDNGTSILENGSWRNVLGGDGMECMIDPTNKSRVYGTLYYGDIRVSNDGGHSFSLGFNRSQSGENAAWIAPMTMDPNNPKTIYVGHQNIYRSNNEGEYGSYSSITNWSNQSTLRNIEIAPSNSNVIYASTLSSLYVTYNGGSSWTNIMNSGTGITGITIDQNDPKRIWVSKSGFSSKDKVWEYDGENWKNITSNLPNVPTNSIVYQHDSPDRLYLATDVGVFFSDYNSAFWQRYGSGLPNVIVFDLEINYNNNKLRAGSYGRGLWEVELDFCDISQPQVNASGNTNFCIGDSVVLSAVSSYPSYEWSTGETTPQIAVKESGAYSLKIVDQSGCEAWSEAVFVEVFDIPDLSVTTTNDMMLCVGGTLNLRANFGFAEYLWSNGETTRTIEIDEPGYYWVNAVTNEGCNAQSEEFEVIYSVPEKPEIGQNGNVLVSSEASRYQWYYQDERIFGATSREYIMKEDEDGEYRVETFNESDCNATSDVYNAIVGVNDLIPGEFVNVHPNPTEGHINIDMRLLRGDFVNIEITDINGNVIYEAPNISKEGILRHSADISNQPAGVYLMIVSNNDIRYVKKIIKQ